MQNFFFLNGKETCAEIFQVEWTLLGSGYYSTQSALLLYKYLGMFQILKTCLIEYNFILH